MNERDIFGDEFRKGGLFAGRECSPETELEKMRDGLWFEESIDFS